MLGIGIFGLLEFVLFFGILFIAVSAESILFPFVTILIFSGMVIGLNHFDFVPILTWIYNNQGLTLLSVVGYIFSGIVWSLFKWYIKVLDLAKVARDILEHPENYVRDSDFEFKFTYTTKEKNYPVRASDHKHDIMLWMIWWWISIPITVFGDFFVRMWNKIYDMTSKLYQKISDHIFAGINPPTVKSKEKN
jgi:hypothetical protein